MLPDTRTGQGPLHAALRTLAELPLHRYLYTQDDLSDLSDLTAPVLHDQTAHVPPQARPATPATVSGMFHLCWCVADRHPLADPWSDLLSAAAQIATAREDLNALEVNGSRHLTSRRDAYTIAAMCQTVDYLTAEPNLGLGANHSAGQLTSARRASGNPPAYYSASEQAAFTAALARVTDQYHDLVEDVAALAARWQPERLWPWWQRLGRHSRPWVVIIRRSELDLRCPSRHHWSTLTRDTAALAGADKIALHTGSTWHGDDHVAFIVPGCVVTRARIPQHSQPRWLVATPVPPKASRDTIEVALRAAAASGDWDRFPALLTAAVTATA